MKTLSITFNNLPDKYLDTTGFIYLYDALLQIKKYNPETDICLIREEEGNKCVERIL